MNIPESNRLPINKLAACFNNTSATYKFYWFLSILQSIESGKEIISKRELFSRMISNAWYTVNYFKISFGKQDLIQTAIHFINKNELITIDENAENIFNKLKNTENKETIKQLWHFDKNVPHWFLSPWFPGKSTEIDSNRIKRIYLESKSFESNSIYGLHQDSIEINPEWIYYLTDNIRVLKDFCYWNLVIFLQSKNPNVPDIPNKIIKPPTRNNLTKQRKLFWDIVIDEMDSVECIYTKRILNKSDYAVEHFIPYSFVSHDLIWNLVPADKSFNSSKSNKLPQLDKYFMPFYTIQKCAFDIIKTKNPNSKILEDYLTVFSTIDESLDEKRFREVLQPLVTIASNNGFEYMK